MAVSAGSDSRGAPLRGGKPGHFRCTRAATPERCSERLRRKRCSSLVATRDSLRTPISNSRETTPLSDALSLATLFPFFALQSGCLVSSSCLASRRALPLVFTPAGQRSPTPQHSALWSSLAQ